MNEIASNILQSIDIIVDKKIKEAQFNSTIVAEVVRANHPNYTVRYQDLFLEAQTLAFDYAKGDKVYVLVPFNDYGRNKYILGLIDSSKQQSPSIVELQDSIKRLELEIQKLKNN